MFSGCCPPPQKRGEKKNKHERKIKNITQRLTMAKLVIKINHANHAQIRERALVFRQPIRP